eukprot:TRINITY_DN7799_c0_g2_i1.p1 TRINITY_DN7799_c0_g2~~TRINITY_DN7799_c0_g2_i1.p1  ORF type:complete len:838 (-),score=135.87 TRINITY_DN7799_c0_g2_i1:107-2461(-)
MESDAASASSTFRPPPTFKPDAQRGGVLGESALIMGGHNVQSDNEQPEEAAFSSRRKSFTSLVKRKSKGTVSPEELNSVRDYVMNEVTNSKQDLLVQLSNAVSNLQADVDTLGDSLSKHKAATAEALKGAAAESQRFTLECSTHLQNDLNKVRYSIERRMHAGFEATEQQFKEMSAMELLAHDRLEQIVNIVQAKLSATMAVRWASSVALMDQHRREVTDLVEELRESARLDLETTRSKLFLDVESLRELHRNTTVRHDKAIGDNYASLQDRLDTTVGLNDKFMAAMSRKSTAMEDSLKTAVEALKNDSERRIHSIEVESHRLFKVVSEVENLPTRRVEWQIKAASVRLQTTGEKSWLSPKFEAAGAHNLQLELRMLPEDSSDTAGVDGDGQGSTGDCAVVLWSDEGGLRLVCKLFIGSMSAQLHHTFDGSTPLSTGRMNCFMKDQIQKQEDTLCVGIEILEAVREVRNLPRPPSADRQRQRTGELVEGPLISHRHLNHRTMELVQEQVDLMRSRMVRRIEWRLEQASSLRRLFVEGECACSTPFEAAGMSGMQLVFYPSGYTGVKENYCSLFLHCPGGTALRCWLWAGKQKREARLSFENAGFLGRTNFCRYDSCVEADDSVLLVLEIEEAQQDTTESMWHQPGSRRCPSSDSHAKYSRPPSAFISGNSVSLSLTGRDSEPRSTPPPANSVDRVDSTLKFRKTPGKIALEDVKQLPSIWTARPQINVSEALEGFHQLSDLRGVMKKPPSARGPPSRQGTKEREGTHTSTATPPVAPRYTMYAA